MEWQYWQTRFDLGVLTISFESSTDASIAFSAGEVTTGIAFLMLLIVIILATSVIIPKSEAKDKNEFGSLVFLGYLGEICEIFINKPKKVSRRC